MGLLDAYESEPRLVGFRLTSSTYSTPSSSLSSLEEKPLPAGDPRSRSISLRSSPKPGGRPRSSDLAKRATHPVRHLDAHRNHHPHLHPCGFCTGFSGVTRFYPLCSGGVPGWDYKCRYIQHNYITHSKSVNGLNNNNGEHDIGRKSPALSNHNRQRLLFGLRGAIRRKEGPFEIKKTIRTTSKYNEDPVTYLNGCIMDNVSDCDTISNDSGGAQAISEALEHYELRERVDSLAALPDNLSAGGGKAGGLESRMKTRRMSTPHPIKMRLERSPPNQHRVRRGRLRRSRSAPDLLDRAKRTKRVFQASSIQAGDLAVQPADLSSDEEELEGCDSMSLETASETSSVSSVGRQAILDEIFEEEPPSYVEALWDHVTMDPEELGFRAGDVIEVTDMTDKDWWWGKLREKEGWFPATFVRLRANQEDTADDFAARVKEGMLDSDLILQRYSPHLLSKEQARTNVVNEILNAEREYVKRLRDVIEGYVEKCRKRPEMFTKEQMDTIFSNIEAIHTFSQGLLKSLEEAYVTEAVQKSQIGQVFLKHSKGFAIYSEYCNNHPHACEELRTLQKSKKFQHFFEACRLLQQMIEIPLEGFLLTPVQKICKYPLQLAELLKYTRTDHPDYQLLSDALVAMKEIAVLINERKRKMESLQKLEEWQDLVQDWEGPDLLERSSELIFCGELTKVTSSGWSQERIFFMFDYQIIYCKKDLLWRDIMVYKGQIDIENAEVVSVEDGKDAQFNTTVRNGIKIYDPSKDKWFLLYARTAAEKERWLRAFEEEKNRREQDKKNGFCLEEYRRKIPMYSSKQKSHPDKSKDKGPKRKVSRLPFAYTHDVMKNIPSHVTLPRGVASREALLYGQMSHKKRGWNPFSSKKTKR